MRRGAVKNQDGQAIKDVKINIPDAQLPITLWVQDKALQLRPHFSLMQHKPRGRLSARKDPLHPTAYELLADAPLFAELRAVGRLDLETSGLLLWTTQGEMVHALTHPKKAVIRRYQAILARPFVLEGELSQVILKDGYRPQIESLRYIEVADTHPALLRDDGANLAAEISIYGGAYHEVRRIFAALQSHVLSLCRVQHGPWHLPPKLAPGGFQEIDLQSPPV